MKRLRIIAVVLLVLGLAAGLWQRRGTTAVTTHVQHNAFPHPFNHTLTPMGTYQLAPGVKDFTIEVRLGTLDPSGAFVPDPKEPARIASAAPTNTWTAATFTNLPAGKTYAIESRLVYQRGGSPAAVAAVQTADTTP